MINLTKEGWGGDEFKEMVIAFDGVLLVAILVVGTEAVAQFEKINPIVEFEKNGMCSDEFSTIF